MERGEIGVDDRAAIVFVFEGLLAKLKQRSVERLALATHKWNIAVSAWEFDFQVLDYITRLVNKYDQPVRVITWHPLGFEQALSDRLWAHDVPVSEVSSVPSYERVSQLFAVDPGIAVVYDPDPAHRNGYGFKAREFDIGRV